MLLGRISNIAARGISNIAARGISNIAAREIRNIAAREVECKIIANIEGNVAVIRDR